MASLHLTVQSVQALAGTAVPRLKITGFYKYEDGEQIRILGGVAHVTLGNVEFAPIAFASGKVLSSVMQRGHSNNFELYLLPDPEIFRRIEASKVDTTVDLQVQMRFAVFGGTNKFDSGYGQMTQPFTIKTRDWIAILEAFGIGSRWQATVVVPGGPFAAAFEKMEPDMKQAFTHWAMGNYPEALVSSRKVLEGLWDVVGDTATGASQWPTNGRFRNEVSAKLDAQNLPKAGKDPYSTKLYRYAESLHKMHHMGAHDGYVVTKPIAETCYTGTLLVLQAISEALGQARIA